MLICKIYANLSVITISAYIKKYSRYYNFPLDRVSGFSHSKVKELSGGIVYGFTLFVLSHKFNDVRFTKTLTP